MTIMMMMMMMIMTDPFTTNLVVKGPVAKGSVVKGAHPIIMIVIINITILGLQVHGTADDNVHLAHSMHISRALIENGIMFKQMVSVIFTTIINRSHYVKTFLKL